MKRVGSKTLTISLLSIPLSAGIALVPVLSDVAAAFPAQREFIHLLITVPSLFMVFSSPQTDRLAKKTSVKFVAAASLFIIAFAGISPYWINGFSYLLITRALMGTGLGLLNTAVASLPALYFDDDKARDYAVGVQSAFVCAGGILFNLLSGAFARYGWKYVFLVQFLNVIPLLTAILLMPGTKGNPIPSAKIPKAFAGNAAPVAAAGFVITILTCTYPLNLSLFAERQGLGGSQFASLLAGVNSAIGFAVGLIFGKAYSKMKGKTLSLSLALSAASLLLVACSQSREMLFLGSVCFGIGTSLVSPSLYAILYERVKPGEVVSSAAMLGIACNVSQFVSPFVINPIAKIADVNGGEKTRFIVAGAFILLLAAALHPRNKKRADG